MTVLCVGTSAAAAGEDAAKIDGVSKVLVNEIVIYEYSSGTK